MVKPTFTQGKDFGVLIPFKAERIQGSERMACHMLVDWEGRRGEKGKTPEDAPLCRGLLTFMKNSVKYPENAEAREAMKSIEKDTETVFQWPHEFIEHHTKK